MKPVSNYRLFMVAGGIIAASAILAAYFLYISQAPQTGTDAAIVTTHDDDDGGRNATIVVAKGIDAIDSGVTFNPPFVRVIAGHNDTVTWVNRNETSITLGGIHGGFFRAPYFENVTLAPGESFSFTYGNRTGIYQYYEKSAGRFGTVLVSTEELEEARVSPASPSILQKSPEETAKVIAKAVDPGDDIASVRLDNTRMVAYVTQKGVDILVPRLCTTCDPSSYYPVHYASAPGKAAFPMSKSTSRLMNFTKGVMEAAGYRMDGSEQIDAVNSGDTAHISIYQKVNREWALPVPGAYFAFAKDYTIIELGRWYENGSISTYRFGLSPDQAREVAGDFMDGEVAENPQIAKYAYRLEGVGQAQVNIIDDKVMYIVPVAYAATNPEYLDDRDHCNRPAWQTFEVMVDAATGKSFDWQLATCV